MEKPVKIGDVIKISGLEVKIAKIYHQEHYGAWDIEFMDNYGIHRSWKQMYDGGVLIRK